ncbi:MAG: hypothetical protein PHY14_03110 [Candidatus Gracilibacteria bacterium]|nr:hypothetical protein [Candidatus Gracilibacteria bacterium]
MKILIGLFFIAIGIAIMRYRYQIYNFTGDWDWALKYLGGNGTVLAITLIGMGFVAVGAAWPFGAFDNTNGKVQNPTIVNGK